MAAAKLPNILIARNFFAVPGCRDGMTAAPGAGTMPPFAGSQARQYPVNGDPYRSPRDNKL